MITKSKCTILRSSCFFVMIISANIQKCYGDTVIFLRQNRQQEVIMALADCNTTVDKSGRELLDHGTTAFPIACYHDDFRICDVHKYLNS